MLKKIEDKLNNIGIFEIDDSEFEYSENPKHLRVVFYIDTKYEFITNKNKLLIKYLEDEGRLDVDEFLEICNGIYPYCVFFYEDGKFSTSNDLLDFSVLRIYKSLEFIIVSILNEFY